MMKQGQNTAPQAPGIEILLYGRTGNMVGSRLHDVLGTMSRSIPVNLFFTLEDLFHRLRSPREHGLIAVLLPADRRELFDIVVNHDIFDDVPMLVVLPDRQRVTVALGHTMRPRFLCHNDDNPSELADVMGKLIEHELKRRSLSFIAQPSGVSAGGG